MKNKWNEKIISIIYDLKNNSKATYAQISSYINKQFNLTTTPNSVRKALYWHNLPVLNHNKDKLPKILLLDIETAPMLAYVWGLWDNNVALNQLKDDWYILSWAAKWYHEDTVMYMDQRNEPNIEDDKKLLKKIWKLMDEADIIVTQNGKSFDIKKLNARFILNGMQPPSSFKQYDTKIIAKRNFGFTSNKLEYMTNKLCTKYKKLDHAKFSGFSMWREVMKGNMEAWKEMEIYNKHDVLSMEELFEKLMPWDGSINLQIYSEDLVYRCFCGSSEFKKSGFHYTNSAKFVKYKCVNCGSEHRDKTNLLSKEQKLRLKSPVTR